MQAQCSTGSDMALKRREKYITFPTHPFDPPSSPPPTSPLPPLPEIAPYSHGSPASNLAPLQAVLAKGKPARPPRPQTSLPNLAPRTITSPDFTPRQRHSAALMETTLTPKPLSRRQKSPKPELQVLRVPKKREMMRLLRPVSGTSSKFSDDVLGALPRLFDKFSPSQSTQGKARTFYRGDASICSWHLHHVSPLNSPGLTNSSLGCKVAKIPETRSALFIPNTPPEQRNRLVPLDVARGVKCSRGRDVRCDIRTAQRYSPDSDDKMTISACQSSCHQVSHKRSPVVSSFAFNFGESFGLVSSPTDDENLTSLPRIPSDPILLVNATIGKTPMGKKAFPRFSAASRSLEETVKFAALPYAQTLRLAGPKPKSERGNPVRLGAHCDIEAAEEETRQLTEEEIRVEYRKRISWATATATLVIVATAGILIGIIWKLRSLT